MRIVNARNVYFFSLGAEVALLSQSPSFGLGRHRPTLLLIHFSLLHSLPVLFMSPSSTPCPTPHMPNHLYQNSGCVTFLPALHSLVSVSLVAFHPWQSVYLAF